MADFDKAISLNKNYAPIYNNRGIALLKQKQYDKAIAEFDKAIIIQPNYGVAYLNRGITFEALGKPENACNDWKKAKELGIDNAGRYANIECEN